MRDEAQKLAYCRLPFEEAYIYSGGEVTFGCCQDRLEALGNVLEQSLEEIWCSHRAEEVRQATATPELHHLCRYCRFVDHIAKGILKPWYEPHSPRWPYRVWICLPDTHCNIGGENPTPETACIMCPRASVGFIPREAHTDRIVANIRSIVPHLSAIDISGLSEAFWKDRIFDILEQLGFSEHADRIMAGTISNGITLSKRTRERWFRTCPKSRIIVSIDAATPLTYRKIRRLDAYNLVISNIRDYVKERNKYTNLIHINNNISLINVTEVEEMIEVASDLGVDGIMLNLTAPAGVVGPYTIGDDTALLFAAAHNKAVKRAEELGVALHFVQPLYDLHPELAQFLAA